MAKKIVPIKYTSRDYESIRNDLIQHAKRYYPETYKDFSEASFGSLMVDTVAYVGDILSFYLDYQANESFLDTASEFNNILKIGRQTGYKFSNSNSSTGIASFYISIPANSSGLGPNMDYAPILKKGSTFSTNTAVSFILNEDVRFDDPRNEIRVLKVDVDTGTPIFYAVKAKGSVISGVIGVEKIQVGAYERFKKVALQQLDIIEILSIFDSEGNEYYEVDYLSQNIIYKSIPNNNVQESGLAKEILKPYLVPRRFVIDNTLRGTSLQFGASSDQIVQDDMSMIAEPTNVVLDLFGKEYISSDSFDPTRLLNSDKFGVGPSDTTLTITYRYKDSNTQINFAANSLTRVNKADLLFTDEQSLNVTLKNSVINSVEINNDSPLLGDNTVIDSDELKRRIENSFASQNRAVTEADYKSLSYLMPQKFGAIKRITVKKDINSPRRNLNLYLLCEGSDGYLTSPNQSVKNNLKTWLDKNRMINDTIDILDGKIVNYAINFVAVGSSDRSKYDILTDAINQIKIDFARLPDFGEQLTITNVYDSLKKVDGLIDVTSVTIEERVGGLYSDAQFNFKAYTSPDNRYIKVPDNVIMELKYPNSNIKGTIL
jgi:hypothetical protein